MEDHNRPNKSPNPDGRFTLFPGKEKAQTFTLDAERKRVIAELATEARRKTGKAISQSDIVGAAVVVAGEPGIVDWIVQEVERRNAAEAEGPPGPDRGTEA